MKANTAAGLMLAGIALSLFASHSSAVLDRTAQIIALLVAALGLATFGQYLFGWNLGIDELLFLDTGHAFNAIRGRMSPFSAAAFSGAGLAIAGLPVRRLRPLIWFASISVILVGVVSILGYAWNATELVTDRWLPPVALNTAVAFALIGSGTLLVTSRSTVPPGGASIRFTRVELKVLSGYIAALLLLLICGGFTYRSTIVFVESARWVTRSQEVRGDLGRLYSSISDAESAQRSYILTGDAARKSDYRHFSDEVSGYVKSLKRLVADNRSQMQTLSELQSFIVRRMNALSRNLTIYEAHGSDAARADLTAGERIHSMEVIRGLTRRMSLAESDLMVQRERFTDRDRQITLASLLFTMSLATTIFILLFRSIRREIVARERAELQLQAANKELEAFSYSVSHDLRAPLRSIDGFSHALLEEYEDKLDNQGKDYLQRVRGAAQRMGELIDDLLNLSGVSRGEMRLEKVNLSELAKSIAAELQGAEPERVLEMVIAEGMVATGDGGLLKAALENLIGNAWKFTGKRPDAKIELGIIHSNGNHDYFVRDNGAGFDAAHGAKLFGAFQRLHDASEFPGTGIGLATVQRIIHRHGGEIWAEGEPNKGATFYFTLPGESATRALTLNF